MAKRLKKRAGRKRRAMAPRYPDGTPYRHARVTVPKGARGEDGREIDPNDYGDPTRENLKRREKVFGSRRAVGELENALDVIASPKVRLITEKQAEAGRRYAIYRDRALRAMGVNPGPASPGLSDWIDRGSVQGPLPVDDGKASYHWRKARLCIVDCGYDVKEAVEKVCINNEPPQIHQVTKLRIGLDALIRMWRL